MYLVMIPDGQLADLDLETDQYLSWRLSPTSNGLEKYGDVHDDARGRKAAPGLDPFRIYLAMVKLKNLSAGSHVDSKLPGATQVVDA